MTTTPEALKMKATLGLTGVTVNAVALITPDAGLESFSSSRRDVQSHRV
jgi:hypothetical protein